MAAEIELKRINQYVSDLVEITDVVGAYVYGINENGNSVKIAVSTIAAEATDYSSTINSLRQLCNGNAQLIAQLQNALTGKSNVGHQHAISDVNGLNTELSGVKDRLQALEDAELDIDSELSETSENPVQNKVIKSALDTLDDKIDNKPDSDTTYSAGSGINIDGNNNAISVKIDNDTITLDGQGRLKAAPAVTVDSKLSIMSENPVQNKVIKAALDAKTTDSELAPVAKTGNYNDLTNLPEIRTDFVPQVSDLDNYAAKDGKIVQYTGGDTEKYKNGHIYKYIAGDNITIPANTPYFQLTEDFPHFPKGYYVRTTEIDRDYKRNYTNFYYHDTNFLNGRTIKNEYGENVHIALQNLNIGVGSIRSAAITTSLEPALFQIGDIAWDELNNLYRVTEITSSALYLELYRQAYKGKVTLDGGRTFIKLSEIIGQRVFPVQGIGHTRFQRAPEYYVNSRGNKVTLIAVETPGYKYGCFKRIGNSGTPEWSCDGFLNKINYAYGYNLRDAEEIYYSGCTDIQTQTYEQVINDERWEEIIFSETDSVGVSLSFDENTSTLFLKDDNNDTISAIDLSVFTRDGMLEDVEFYNVAEEDVEVEPPYLKFIFNTSSGHKPVRVSLASLNISFDVDAELSISSRNPVENRVVTVALNGKANQTEMAEIHNQISEINRVISESSLMPCVPLVKDLDNYEPIQNQIVKYNGASTQNYVHGYDYEFVGGQSYKTVTIPAGAKVVTFFHPNGTVEEGFELSDSQLSITPDLIYPDSLTVTALDGGNYTSAAMYNVGGNRIMEIGKAGDVMTYNYTHKGVIESVNFTFLVRQTGQSSQDYTVTAADLVAALQEFKAAWIEDGIPENEINVEAIESASWNIVMDDEHRYTITANNSQGYAGGQPASTLLKSDGKRLFCKTASTSYNKCIYIASEFRILPEFNLMSHGVISLGNRYVYYLDPRYNGEDSITLYANPHLGTWNTLSELTEPLTMQVPDIEYDSAGQAEEVVTGHWEQRNSQPDKIPVYDEQTETLIF